MAKKRTSLDGLLVSQVQAPEPPVVVQQPSIKNDIKRQTVYLPEEVYEQLRTLAFEERHKMHDYLIEGLDMVFKSRGLKSIAALTKKKD